MKNLEKRLSQLEESQSKVGFLLLGAEPQRIEQYARARKDEPSFRRIYLVHRHARACEFVDLKSKRMAFEPRPFDRYAVTSSLHRYAVTKPTRG